MTGDAIDLAAIAWRGVEGTPTNIMKAGSAVRSVLSDNPGVSDLDDEQALLLLPATALAVTTVDPVLVSERARRVRAVLDAATAPTRTGSPTGRSWFSGSTQVCTG